MSHGQTFNAVIVPVDGPIQVVPFSGYDDIKAALNDGWLELIPVGTNFVCYVDEDGTAKGLRRNERATRIVKAMLCATDRMLIPGDFIKGTAVFTGSDGESETDIPADVILKYFRETVPA